MINQKTASTARRAWLVSVEDAIAMGFDGTHSPRFVIGEGSADSMPLVEVGLFEDYWMLLMYGTETKIKYFDRYCFEGTPAVAQLKQYMVDDPVSSTTFARWMTLMHPSDALGIQMHSEANHALKELLQTMQLALALERNVKNGKPRTKIRNLAKHHATQVEHAINRERLLTIARAGLPDVAFEALCAEIDLLTDESSTIFVSHV